MIGVIHYGFGRDYLKDWGIKEALREIYQNFLDYGEYDEENYNGQSESDADIVYVDIVNGWAPDSLEFLRIGNSSKGPGSIGKHGEGLKMAFLILLREGYHSEIITPKFKIKPAFYSDSEIGECFCFEYAEHGLPDQKYQIRFTCNANAFKEFKDNIVNSNDVVFGDDYFGSIVNKTPGNIYSGRLFVCCVDNVSRAYDINPRYMTLDRDRKVPRAFDVSYASSKINQAYGKWSAKDNTCSDTAYIDEVPEEIKKEFKPQIVGNTVKFVVRNDKGEDEVVNNHYVQEALRKDSLFAGAIKKLKQFIAKQLGLYDMLLEFRDKHVHGTDALADFEIILERIADKQHA